MQIDDNENTMKADDMEMSNEPSSDLFSDGDTERVVYEQKNIQGSGLSTNFSVISLSKNGSNISDNNNQMEVDENESTIAYNNKTAPNPVKEEKEDESTIVYNNNANNKQKDAAGPNNIAPANQIKKEPPKPAAAKKKGNKKKSTSVN